MAAVISRRRYALKVASGGDSHAGEIFGVIASRACRHMAAGEIVVAYRRHLPSNLYIHAKSDIVAIIVAGSCHHKQQ